MNKILSMALLLALPLAAQAQSQPRDRHAPSQSWSRLSYTYGELRYVVQDPDGGGDDFDGLRLGGSLQFQPQWFAAGALTSVSSGPVDIDTIDLGIGFRSPMQNNVDLVAIGGLVFADVETPGFSDDDSGISLTGGVRAMVAPQFELGGYVGYVDLYGDGDVGLTGEALFHVTPQATLLASLGLSDDVNTITLGGRWNFY